MSKSRTVPVLVAVALTLIASIFVGRNLQRGHHLSYDEFLSLEKSAGFARFHDWMSVYSYNVPSAEKPPLQYWLIALAMKIGMSDILALRLWSYLFWVGLLMATAWTSHYLCPDNAWVVPAAVLLTCSSVQLTHLARSGLLDAGMGFLMMSCLLSFCYARRKPRLWLLCGLFAGLGALQKAPVALLYLGVLLVVLNIKRDADYRFATLKRNRSFKQGVGLSLCLMASWPLLQTFKFGVRYSAIAFGREMLLRFLPVGKGATGHSGVLTLSRWLWSDLHILGVLAGLCSLCLVMFARWRKENTAFAVAVLTWVVIMALAMASGKTYSRYLAILTPLLICQTAKVVSDVVPRRPLILVVAGLLFAASVVYVEPVARGVEGSDTYARNKALARYIDEYRQRSDYVMIDAEVMPPSAYGYFGSDREQFGGYWRGIEKEFGRFRKTLGKTKEKRCVMGLGRAGERARILDVDGRMSIVASRGDFLIWRYCPLSGAEGRQGV